MSLGIYYDKELKNCSIIRPHHFSGYFWYKMFLWNKNYVGDCEVKTILSNAARLQQTIIEANKIFARFNEQFNC